MHPIGWIVFAIVVVAVLAFIAAVAYWFILIFRGGAP